MLHNSESISSYSRSNIAIWMVMAFQAGLLNMGGFMACHRFVSHVTGFATFFGYELSQVNYSAAFGMLTVPLFFLIGAMVSGHLVDVRLRQKKHPQYYSVFGLMTLLILIVLVGGVFGQFGKFGEPIEVTSDYVLLALLCLTCGIQNATITSVSRSVVRTTHLTGITTDLGIGLMRVFSKNQSAEEKAHESRANHMRMGIIGFFVLGSVVAGFMFSHFQYYGFILPFLTSGNLFLAMLHFRNKSISTSV